MRHLLLVFILGAVQLTASSASAADAKSKAPLRERAIRGIGWALGFAAGFVVTTGLAASKKWNAPLVHDGHPVVIRHGQRVFQLRQRHTPVLGPRIVQRGMAITGTSFVSRLRRSWLIGFGEGATKAPPAEGAVEAFFLAK